MKHSLRNLMLVLALSAVLWAGMVVMLPLLAANKRVWLLLALFLVVFVGTVASFWSRRRRFAATLDGETIEKMKVQRLDQNSTQAGRIGTTLLSLPRFNIAQLMVFTLVCAVDVWAFLWDPCIGCWATFVSQVLFWTVVRVRAVLRLESQSPPQKRREWFWGIVIISVVTSVGAVVTFLVVVMAQVPVVVILTKNLSDAAVAAVLLGLCVPIGIIAAGICLWLTWPRAPTSSPLNGISLPTISAPAASPPLE